MAYSLSPMQIWNRMNPFVILLKKEYYGIMDQIQEFTKVMLGKFIGALIPLVITLIPAIFMCNSNISWYWSILSILVVIIEAICLLLLYRGMYNDIELYMRSDPAMKHFDSISNATLSDTLTMHEEDLLDALNQLKEMHGRFNASIKMWKYRLNVIIIVYSIICILYITLAILTIIFGG